MKSIDEIQDEIIDEFSVFDDWMDKYALLIDLGNSLPPIEEKYKTNENLIEGCQSRVWLQADYRDGRIWFEAESDAIIVKGIVSLLVRVLSGRTPDEILNYRSDRAHRAPVAHPLQRVGGHGQADAHVCLGLQSEKQLNHLILKI